MNDHYRIVFDVDGTLCGPKPDGGTYLDCPPKPEVIEKLREYRERGFAIVLSTARGMRTYSNDVAAINENVLPVLLQWLEKHDVPFDELHVGKPWCGFEGLYVDDRTVRPDEFCAMEYDELKKLISSVDGGAA
ncbi:MAG: capsular biosynthesis protein [Fimbriimonadaceae bacterium]